MVLNDMALHKILLLLYAVLQHVCVCVLHIHKLFSCAINTGESVSDLEAHAYFHPCFTVIRRNSIFEIIGIPSIVILHF